jgi:hypothetical protein
VTRLVCATHGHCFDGLASAALLTSWIDQEKDLADVHYFACGYAYGSASPTLDGDENALLDFRYESGESLTYYIDHHPTAFSSAEQKSHFSDFSQKKGRCFIWDPTATSCAGLIANIARVRAGIDLRTKYADLIDWAERIDGAAFTTVEEATDRSEPVMRLVSVVERFGDTAFLNKAVPVLRSEGLSALAESKLVKGHYRTIAPLFRAYERRIKSRGVRDGRVGFFDLTESPTKVVAKFTHYRQFPDALYSVMVTNIGNGIKVSVGFNPWHGAELDLDIGAICARYGGGGHAVVGAIAFSGKDASRAQAVAKEIIRELQAPGYRATS